MVCIIVKWLLFFFLSLWITFHFSLHHCNIYFIIRNHKKTLSRPTWMQSRGTRFQEIMELNWLYYEIHLHFPYKTEKQSTIQSQVWGEECQRLYKSLYKDKVGAFLPAKMLLDWSNLRPPFWNAPPGLIPRMRLARFYFKNIWVTSVQLLAKLPNNNQDEPWVQTILPQDSTLTPKWYFQLGPVFQKIQWWGSKGFTSGKPVRAH